MTLLRSIARLAIAWVFLRAGFDVVRNPARPAATASSLLGAVRRRAPVDLPEDTVIVRANAAFQIGAASLFAAGVAPRASAIGLIGSLAPTTIGGHAFWKVEDEALRPNQRNHFNKNLAIIGGLLFFVLERRDQA